MKGRVQHGLIGAATLALGVAASGCGRGDVFFVENNAPVSTTAAPGGTSSGGATTGGTGTGGTSSGGTVIVPPPVTTLAGNGAPSSQSTSAFADGSGGPNGTAEFNGPEGVAVDAAGNVYVGDAENFRVRKIDPAGNVTTLAGNGIPGDSDGTGGPNGMAEFSFPSGIAVDSVGVVYVADASNNRIARVDPDGNVTTIVARGTQFLVPSGVAVDFAENLFVADTQHNRVLRIDQAGMVTTVAGNGSEGYQDGTGGPNGTAVFAHPTGLAVDADGYIFVADFLSNRIRRIDSRGNVSTLAGNGMQGYYDGTGGAEGTAMFDSPVGLAIDSVGNVYVGDASNNRIRKIDTNGNVTTLAGNGIEGFADGTLGPLGTAEFHSPAGVAVDSATNVYVADALNNRIRKIVQ
jgi:sugar lactone lactonase YvrE